MKKLLPLFLLAFSFLLKAPLAFAETAPVALQLDPDTARVSSGESDFYIKGEHFQEGHAYKVAFQGAEKEVQYVSDNKLRVHLEAGALATAGSYVVKVYWKNSAGEYAPICLEPFIFKVIEGSAASVEIQDISPHSIEKGADGMILYVKGRGLADSHAEVGFDGIRMEIMSASDEELKVKIPAELLREARDVRVKVSATPTETTLISQVFEFKVTSTEASRMDSNGSSGPGAAGPAADAGCSLSLGAASGNAWFMIFALATQVGLFLRIRKA